MRAEAVSDPQSNYRGCMLGLAIGDALGLPTEFLSLEEIHRRFGPKGVTDFTGEAAVFTDDTEMTIATARALIEADSDDVETVMQAISRHYAEWLKQPGEAPGGTCLRGAHRLRDGVPWRESGDPHSKGCGSAMRSAPIGLRHHGNIEAITNIGVASSICTHGHPCALAGSIATAFLVSRALDGASPEGMHREMRSLVEPMSDTFVRLWDRIPEVIDEDPDDVCDLLGEGWVAEEAVACAFWCFWKSPDDYERTVWRAVNSKGDSDSLGCIAGAVSGARLGEQAIPAHWRRRITRGGELVELADRLWAASTRKSTA